MSTAQIKKEVPIALVKTWYELFKNGPDKDIRAHGLKMLTGAFDSIADMEAYLKRHGELK